MASGKFRFAIDRGGTFTDIYAEVPDPVNPFRVLKLLSEDPKHYQSAPREGIRRILEEVTGIPHPRHEPTPVDRIESILMGTTVATNALLERKGSRTALVTSRGFRDLLHIGTQSRPFIFDLTASKPDSVYEAVVEVDERVVLLKDGGAEKEDLPAHVDASADSNGYRLPMVTGTTGERLLVERAPVEAEVVASLRPILDAGITSVAIVFMHAYTFPEHERAVAKIARGMGFTQVSLSSELMPMVKIVPRGYTAAADAYLTPHIVKYVNSFRQGFAGGLQPPSAAEGGGGGGGGGGTHTKLLFMQSDGGLTPVEYFSGHKAILSGPAGGVVGYALTTYDPELRQPVCAFDMGGTSTDVSRYAGRYEHLMETTIAGVTIQAPQLDINTVAAGGGSRLFFRSGLFAVGPESAGAHPGPVCYRKGGYLAVTDANLQLGRIAVEEFPHIFGETEDQPLDVEATTAAFAELAREVTAFYAAQGMPAKTVDEIAYGFIQVANEAMCRPIRALTQMKGHDLTTHVLACFGGAGPQHACAMARALGMRSIFISRFSGILSAYGISMADVVNEAQAPVAVALIESKTAAAVAAASGAASDDGHGVAVVNVPQTEAEAAAAAAEREASPALVAPGTATDLSQRLHSLCVTVSHKLASQGFEEASLVFELFVNLRYAGTDTAIMVPCTVVSGSGVEEHQLPASSLFPCGSGTAAAAAPLSEATASLISGAIAKTGLAFVRSYKREFGFVLRHRDILVDDVRVRGIATGSRPQRRRIPDATSPAVPARTTSVYFEGGRVPTPVFMLKDLTYGHKIPGPAMLLDRTSTILVEPGFEACITQCGDVAINATTPPKTGLLSPTAGSGATASAAAHTAASSPSSTTAAAAAAAARVTVHTPESIEIAATATRTALEEWRDNPLIEPTDGGYPDVPCDPIQLSIFSHRFMGIAEQCGRTLQRTSVSVNMRERLDYSCALFGPDGGLVANAPHIPVHLGAMQDAVRFQLKYWGANIHEGDVLVSNHPQLAGGSHLPDITVITPVFADNGRIVFFVAARGHHADIGGIAPGSMPPLSKSLSEEGAAIVAFKLVEAGVFQEGGITELLMRPGRIGIPGSASTRNVKDVLSDLRAQVAANNQGIRLVKELIGEYGLRTVHAYMHHIKVNAEVAVRDMLVAFSLARGLPEVGTVRAVDHMDDGSPIALSVTIDRRERTAIFDFTGTGPELYANTNAPRAVTYSAVIYCLRCLVGQDVPLNQGCLAPVSIIVPEGTLLHPSPTAAVVGGNVLTSQRVVDVILRAFGAAAASQGCMNNLTFGNARLGYYATICGGAGAGPGWHGRSGVHSHMTNTRIDDPEILERRYPVVLRQFSLRAGSGGRGKWRGGDGVYRELEFRAPLIVSILSERRAIRPYGLCGGWPGARGVNTLLRWAGLGVAARPINLGGKNTVSVLPGDRLVIATPGGGGYGVPEGEGEGETSSTAEGVTDTALNAEDYAHAVAAATGKQLVSRSIFLAHSAAAAPAAVPPALAFRASGSVQQYRDTQESV